jgi:hypothetical protein
VPAAITSFPLLFRLYKGVEQVRMRMKLPDSPKTRVLLIRSFADEATGVLVTAQFITWIMQRLWRILMLPSKWFGKGGFLLTMSGFLFVALASAHIIEIHLEEPELPWFPDTPFAMIPETAVIIVALVIAIPLLLTAIAGFIAVPTMLIFGIIFGLTVGREMMWACFVIDVSIDDTPPGKWEVLNVPLDEKETRLMHSAVYDSKIALDTICNWIKSDRVASPPRRA